MKFVDDDDDDNHARWNMSAYSNVELYQIFVDKSQATMSHTNRLLDVHICYYISTKCNRRNTVFLGYGAFYASSLKLYDLWPSGITFV